MKIINIAIKNIMGIDEIDFIPQDNVTDVSGKNGAGKSSVFEAIASIITGKANGLLKNESESGHVSIMFDDGSKIIKKFNSSGAGTLFWYDKDGKQINSPAKKIKELFGQTFNPIDFIRVNDKGRLDILLAAFPINLIDGDRAKLLNMAQGIVLEKLPAFNSNDMAFLSSFHQYIYDTRTGFNRLVDVNKKTAVKLSEDIVRMKQNFKETDLDNFNVSSLNSKISLLNEKISVINSQKQEGKNIVIDKYTDMINELKQKMNDECNEIDNQVSGDIITIKQSISDINNQLRNYDSLKSIKDTIKNTEKMVGDNNESAESNEAKSNECSKLLDSIQKVKSNMIKRCLNFSSEIEMDISNGVIYVNSIPFDSLNTAKQIELSILIGAKNIGNARFMLLDGAECLDNDTRKIVEDIAVKHNIQIITFSVSDESDLVIK